MNCPEPPRSRTRRRSRSPYRGAARLTALFLAVSAAHPAAANVGRTTAVVQEAHGTPPAQPTRVLIPKLNLFENERIQTDRRGVTQILFRDGTNMTIGPNSDLVIDRFVYDPDSSAGELAAKLGRGVLRFVGGQISKRGRATIATPVAVIGVRGGIAVVEHDDSGRTNAVLLFGSVLTVEGIGPGAETRRITRPGFSVAVESDGAVSEPVRLPGERLESVLASLEGSEESDGGAPTPPTRESVIRSEYARAPAPVSDRVAPLAPASAEEETGKALVADRPPNEEDEGLVMDGPPDEDAEDRSPALWIYRLDATDVDDLGLSFLSPVRSEVFDLTIVKREGSFDEAMRTGGYPVLRVRNQFSGQGAEQVGAFFIYLGRVIPNGPDLPVRFVGRSVSSARSSATSDTEGAYVIWGILDEDPEANTSPAFRTGAPPTTFRTASGYFRSNGTHVPAYLESLSHLGPTYFRSPTSHQWGLARVAPLEDAGPRGDRDWRGYANALLDVRTTGVNGHEFGGTYSLRNRTGSPQDVIFVADAATGQLGVVFLLGQADDYEPNQGDTSNAADNFAVRTMEINFGRRPNQPVPPGSSISPTRGAYISDEAFAALSSRANFPDDLGDRVVYVNGELVPSRAIFTRTWMAGNDAAPAEGLLPAGVEYCDCPAAKFGWWGGQIGLFRERDEDGDVTQERADSVFPGTFVVGELPDAADIPAEGTATYSGHAAAAVRNAGVAYAAVGGFRMGWDFATRTGEASITNLDGRDYTASDLTAPLANARDFAGNLAQDGGSASGPLAGSFFSEGTNPVQDVGGQFTVEEAGYIAVGSFAATH